ncbi:hypothetical protein ACL00X_20140, partial [Aeromonas diversa]|uniref:hypothetical protein n=1 Tax=Aeromonas diversa TaxID=502790 RepID=UPI00399FA469
EVGAPLLVLTVVTNKEYRNDAEILSTIEEIEGMNYEIGQTTYAKNVAKTAINDLLSDLDIEAKAIGKAVDDVSDRARVILDVAEANDCDYVFL